MFWSNAEAPTSAVKRRNIQSVTILAVVGMHNNPWVKEFLVGRLATPEDENRECDPLLSPITCITK
ncbi:hypothetical protein D3C73_1432860 [compost metagenome]